ncbi:MAG TPA: (Fe-S)-binding protein [Clostridia bacterium]|nr:(Fe-S)-binding protein [Clostridia bacterium]
MDYKLIKQELGKCNKCGFCQEVCPTFKVDGREGTVARGRIWLVKGLEQGKFAWGRDKSVNEYIGNCLLCRACVSNCPASVETDKIMMYARSQAGAQVGFPLYYRLAYRAGLSNKRNLKVGTKVMRFYQKSGIKWLVNKSGVLNLMGQLKGMEERMPVIPPKSFRDMLYELVHDLPQPRYKVGVFVGCATNHFFSQVAASAVRVLQKLNIGIVVPEVQCCGGPHQSAGDFEEAKRLAKLNIDYFLNQEIKYVTTDCATCGSALLEYGELLAGDPDYAEKARLFSSMVIDLNKLLVSEQKTWEAMPLKQVNCRVTYHEPCHLVRGQKITEEPRTVITSVPGVELVEMKDSNRCCGGAGAYEFFHQNLSGKILAQKIQNIKDTKADTVVTCCPACMMQISYGLRKENLPLQVMHPVQLLEKALS